LIEYHDSLADRDSISPLPVSYRQALLAYDYGRCRVRVLCNPPLIAFAADDPEYSGGDRKFMDIPTLESALGECLDGFILRATDAARQPTPERIATLDEWDKKAVDYHRPQQLGEVFFNNWD